MIRLLPDGLLVGWNVVLLWLLLPVPGTWLGLALWGITRYLFYLRHPVEKRLKEALATRDDEIVRLRSRILTEVDARMAAEGKRNELRIRRVMG